MYGEGVYTQKLPWNGQAGNATQTWEKCVQIPEVTIPPDMSHSLKPDCVPGVYEGSRPRANQKDPPEAEGPLKAPLPPQPGTLLPLPRSKACTWAGMILLQAGGPGLVPWPTKGQLRSVPGEP